MDLEEPIVEPVCKKTFSLMKDDEEERRVYGADRIHKSGGSGGGGGDRTPDGEELVLDRYLSSLGGERPSPDTSTPAKPPSSTSSLNRPNSRVRRPTTPAPAPHSRTTAESDHST